MEVHTESPIGNCKVVTNGDSACSLDNSIAKSSTESAAIPVVEQVTEDCRTVPDGSPIKDHVLVKYQHGFTRPRQNAAIIVPANGNELPIPGQVQPAPAPADLILEHQQEAPPDPADQHHEDADPEVHGNVNARPSLWGARLCFEVHTVCEGMVLFISLTTLLVSQTTLDPAVTSYRWFSAAVAGNSLVFVVLECHTYSILTKLEAGGYLQFPEWKVALLYVMFVIVRCVAYALISWIWITMRAMPDNHHLLAPA